MSAPAPATVWLRIELLTDLVVTRRSASVGVHECLDYLPGSVLLGAVAARWFAADGFGPEFFLSGRVRFGDGLPDDGSGCPAWPVPLNCHVAKGARAEDAPLVNPLIAAPANGEQLAQVRDRHLMANGRREGLKKNYQLKTAINRDEFGRAGEGQLFGYEALPAGQVFFAPITFAEDTSDASRQQVIRALASDGIRLGRSRSAQYGAVKITVTPSAATPVWPPAAAPKLLPDKVALYLASDLALVNAQGAPTLVPAAEHFGLFPTAKFLGDESFTRSRRYSPWNAFRNARDSERQVLVRGSVLVFSVAPALDRAVLAARLQTTGVGLHTAEGLGRVLVDPWFVLQPPDASPTANRPVDRGEKLAPPFFPEKAALAWCLRRRAESRSLAVEAEALAGEWTTLCLRYRQGPFPSRSQWNEIREITARESGWLAQLEGHFGLTPGVVPPARAAIWATGLGRLLWDRCRQVNRGELARAALRETAMRIVRTKAERT